VRLCVNLVCTSCSDKHLNVNHCHQFIHLVSSCLVVTPYLSSPASIFLKITLNSKAHETAECEWFFSTQATHFTPSHTAQAQHTIVNNVFLQFLVESILPQISYFHTAFKFSMFCATWHPATPHAQSFYLNIIRALQLSLASLHDMRQGMHQHDKVFEQRLLRIDPVCGRRTTCASIVRRPSCRGCQYHTWFTCRKNAQLSYNLNITAVLPCTFDIGGR
jgi:hypothetical protein